MNITLYAPHPVQKAVHESPARFKVVNFGRRTGKSTLAYQYILAPNTEADWAVKGALQQPGRYWIVAPTYTQAKSIYWRGLLFSKDPGDTTAIPRELIAKVNESELIVTLINGSTIELKGADNPDSLRGAGIKGVVLDEYAFWTDPDAWEYVVQPALSDSGGWAVFISTPNGFNHFYELAVHAQTHGGWSYHHATIWDNPNIADEEKLRLKSELDDDTWSQEYLGEFRKMKGLVYPEFSSSVHVLSEGFSPPLGGTWAMGIDPGTANAFAGVFFFIDYDNNWYLMDEMYERGKTTEQVYHILKQKMGSNYYSTKIADSAAAQVILDLNAIHNLGIEPIRKERDSIQEGIRLNRELLKVQEGTGKPKIFVMPHCRNFVKEIESYRYPPEKPGQSIKEEPIKENDHLMDAWRYVRLANFMPNRKPQKMRKKIYHPVTGRVMGYEN